jgi:hypothetical protein
MRRSLQTAIVGLASWVTLGAAARAAEQPKSALAFERLAFLVGEWKGFQDGAEIQVIYTLTANGSALMEEFRPKDGPTMVTMFSVDGDHLLATHYCAAKNQPQMATQTITDPQATSLAFSLVRVTGLTSRRLAQYWSGGDHGESGSPDSRVDLSLQGKNRKDVFHFTRSR